MSAPGTKVLSRGAPVSGSPPLDTGRCFIAGITEKGAANKALGPFRSLEEVIAATGNRIPTGYVYDFADVYFREGGSELLVGRTVGPSPVTATVTLAGSSEGTLKVDAVSPGAWANDIDIVVTVESGNFTITVKLDGAAVESETFATNTEAVAWAGNSEYIRLTDLGKGDPVAATKELAGGDDDAGDATDTQRKAALGLFTKELGPGQVCYPGGTTTTIHAALLEHAEANNRVALLDLADTATVATLTGVAATDRALPLARYGAAYAPWVVVPGVATGTTRVVPPSALIAGLIGRNDGSGLSPNQAPAGVFGIARYARELSQAGWTNTQRGTLNDAGVNVILMKNGAPRVYGDRTLVNPLTTPAWLQFPNARLNMAIAAEADVVGEEFLFSPLTSVRIGEFGGALAAMLLGHFPALYGDTPEEAFHVETGVQVNPPEDLAEGKLRAVLEVRFASAAEFVTIEIVKTPITEAVS